MLAKDKYPYSVIWLPVIAGFIVVMFLLKSIIPDIYSGTLDKYSWSFNAIPLITNYFYWALFVPVIYKFYDRLCWSNDKSYQSNLTSVLVLTPILAFVHSNIAYWSFIFIYKLTSDLNIAEAFGHIMRSIYAGTVGSYIELWIILGAFSALEYYKKLQQHQLKLANAEKDLSDAKLTSLRMQLNPHFLFNALNSVTSLIDSDKDKAKDMLSEFSSLMRQILAQDKRHSVKLKEDVAFIEQYLEIEGIRFQDRLTYKFDIDSAAENALVPNLLLQPLIENTFKHGFTNKTGQCHIEITASVENDRLLVVISDNGIEAEVQQAQGLGVGLANVRNRLEQMFGSEFEMNFARNQQGGAVVSMDLPYVCPNVTTLSASR